MNITIDNLQGQGPLDFTSALDATIAPRVERKLNLPASFRCGLLAGASGFVVPVVGARVVVTRADGSLVFTGYLTGAPDLEYLGVGETGPAYRYGLIAESDEVLLDQKALPNRAPFVARSAGSVLQRLAEDLLPGFFDTSSVQDVDVLASYAVNPQKKFSFHAAEIALSARASYRAMDGALVLAPVGAVTYAINENDANFSPVGLTLQCQNLVANDVTAIGLDEPQSYVRDYFESDGSSLSFYLSQKPLQQSRGALIDEQYLGSTLDPATWVASDPTDAFSVASQTLQVSGGMGSDGYSTVAFVEQIELGGALELQHGDVNFTAASQGVIGGLYSGTISQANCLAGFQITPSGTATNIQALISGTPTGPVVTTAAGHRYVLTTYLYSMEIYRSGEIYHSSVHPAGSGWGGATTPADVRFVLEVQDIDPGNPATLIAAATVLYDGVISNAPGFATYALVDAINMQCSVAYTYAAHISLAEVRTAAPSSSYVTQLVGPPAAGGQCEIAGSTTLVIYPQYLPLGGGGIVVSYRSAGRALAEIRNSASIASLQTGADDGTRGIVRAIKTPSARTQADCENAALAILDDATGAAWTGIYETWSDFLPGGAEDIFPGDAVAVNVPSRNAVFSAIVRSAAIDLVDPAGDRGMYAIEFANDLAASLAIQDSASVTTVLLQDMPAPQTTAQVGAYYLADLTDAQITSATATTVSVDAGISLPSGYGVEVRAHDFGWGVSNDRNLLGRFSAETFTLPRLTRSQTYFLRLFDSSSPPRYSRYSAALHIDIPLS
ncbi:MAG TPA: hypothetical protein VMH04_19140 [Candidatus Solibacter sp.]|nr:hypothetical protein [Candidatus Solibacter sp.]